LSLKFNVFTSNFDISEGNATDIIAVTIAATNTWTNVPLVNVVEVLDVSVYDQANNEKVTVDIRILTGNTVEIKSKKLNTFTVHVIGT
jgi:hypothetical protein